MFEYESKTLFSRLPAWLNVALMLALSACAIASYSAGLQLLLFALSLSLLLASGFRSFRKLAATLIPLLLFANFGIWLFFSQIDPDFTLRMLIISLRFSTMCVIFAFFLRTTNIFALIRQMRSAGAPESVCLALYITLRFLPEIERELCDAISAQKLRHRSLNPISASVSLLVPMLYSIFERADELSIAYYLRKRSGRA